MHYFTVGGYVVDQRGWLDENVLVWLTPLFDQWVRLLISDSIFMNEICLESREVGRPKAVCESSIGWRFNIFSTAGIFWRENNYTFPCATMDSQTALENSSHLVNNPFGFTLISLILTKRTRGWKGPTKWNILQNCAAATCDLAFSHRHKQVIIWVTITQFAQYIVLYDVIISANFILDHIYFYPWKIHLKIVQN